MMTQLTRRLRILGLKSFAWRGLPNPTNAATRATAADDQRLYDALREARRLNQAKDEFLATLSHELRTPLSVILGYVELLKQETASEPRLQEHLEAIERNARVQTQLVSELLDISSITSGKISLQPICLDMNQIVTNAVASIRFTARTKGLHVACHEAHKPLLIKGDSTRLQQVLWNLLGNAMKFTPSGGAITVSVEAAGVDCLVRVVDTGKGIEPGFLPHVFDRFRQEDDRTTRRFGGLGLGLSISRSIVELHGGSIHALSEGVGRGSEFRFRIPLLDPLLNPTSLPALPLLHAPGRSCNEPWRESWGHSCQTPAAREADPVLRDPEPSRDSVNAASPSPTIILIVEDDPDSRRLLRRYLEKSGATVIAAASAAEAFRLYQETHPDVIVSDISMPDEDGLSFMRRLRAFEKKSACFTPSIALTAFARDEDKKQALQSGFQAHLAKPIDAKTLRDVLRMTLQRLAPPAPPGSASAVGPSAVYGAPVIH